jgi:hypothetical protein
MAIDLVKLPDAFTPEEVGPGELVPQRVSSN